MEFRSIEIQKVYETFVSGILPELIEFYKDSGNKYLSLINETEDLYSKSYKSLGLSSNFSISIEIQRQLKEKLLTVLDQYGKDTKLNSYNTFYNKFKDAVNKELEKIQRVIHVSEEFNGYSISLLGNPFINLKKAAANFRRLAIIYSKRFTNLFRILFHKNPTNVVVYINRRILFRNIARQFIFNDFLKNSNFIVPKLYEKQSSGILKLWELDQLFDAEFQKSLQFLKEGEKKVQKKINEADKIFAEIKSEQQSLLKEIENEIKIAGEKAFTQFDDVFEKIDTLELPNKTYSKKKIDSRQNKISDDYIHTITNWDNTFKALFDDWAVDAEITLLYYSVFDEYNLLCQNIESYINNDIQKLFLKIKNFLAKSRKEIEIAGTSEKEVKKNIIEERKKISSQLVDSILTRTIEMLTGCFAKDFSTLQENISKLAGKVSDNRGFIRNKNYVKGTRVSEIKYISPNELLNFEALPALKDKIKKTEQWLDLQLEKSRINILGLGTVSDFSLESSQIMLEEKSGPSEKAMEIAIEGFNRALGFLEKAGLILDEIIIAIKKELGEAINSFNENILRLKDTENIFNLHLKIAHIKAVERTEKYKELVIKSINKAIPLTKEYFNKVKIFISSRIKDLKKRIGFTIERKFVSFELSEFINQTNESLKQLPFVYQRLYQLNPTDEERFFVNREKELELLITALENWKKNRFVTIAIIGEKGSGITSLINIFLKKANIQIPVIKHTLNHKIYSKDLYYNFFADKLGVKKIETNEQIIDFINQFDETRVIVIENLQHLFLKEVNGFECMNMFFELIANTMKKVLWIGAYTTHSWNYLERTIYISNYFTNEIIVEPMSQETIEEIIFKRNRLSGYHIVFNPSEYHLSNTKYQKMGEIVKQKFLEKDFFSSLLNMSSGNISLAQLYWLKSTRFANNEEIHMSPVNMFDFSFIKNLSSDELFTMQVMIIHDGLELNDYAKLMGKSVTASRNILTPMFEKGLLIKPNLKYNINPIIFRPIVNHLVSRNFIN
ncbi:MAG: hypothetical protein JXB17_13190 [Bacteroidales bacterium]|nr:hypothetical protein [Bacteroidales bacterium]